MTISHSVPTARPGAWLASTTPAVSLAQVALASLAIALAARVEIPLPFTPVPITGQTLVVALAGMTLGPRRGALAVGLYLAEGALGLPVFSGGGSGVAHFAGPTGGYLAGFVLSAASAGWFAERGWDRCPWRAAVAMLASSLWVFLLGAAVLSLHVGGLANALRLGVLPFVPGDLVKTAIATVLLPCVRGRATRSAE